MLAHLRIAFSASLVGLNTLLHAPLLLALSLVKLAVPIARFRTWMSRVLVRIAESWVAVNSALIERFTPTRFEAQLPPGLDPNGRYLVLCNHQSWCDIPVLQAVFNRRLPLLRFFLKQELIWVPLLGPAWWALDFPFMKRHSRTKLLRNPALRSQDLDATRKACAKFSEIPVAIMNFVEGTRFTEDKHAKQNPPYRHLLRPRAGGVGAVFEAMGDKLQSVLDVTLVYGARKPSMAALLAGTLGNVEVHVQQHAIPPELLHDGGDGDEHERTRIQRWINTLWASKDALIQSRIDHRHATTRVDV